MQVLLLKYPGNSWFHPPQVRLCPSLSLIINDVDGVVNVLRVILFLRLNELEKLTHSDTIEGDKKGGFFYVCCNERIKST